MSIMSILSRIPQSVLCGIRNMFVVYGILSLRLSPVSSLWSYRILKLITGES